jgi:hypothetical protein
MSKNEATAAADAGGKGREPIRPRCLKFHWPTDVPGKSMASSVTAGGLPNSAHWEIEYVRPWMRVSFHRPGEPTLVEMVHETRCSWSP